MTEDAVLERRIRNSFVPCRLKDAKWIGYQLLADFTPYFRSYIRPFDEKLLTAVMFKNYYTVIGAGIV